MHKENDITFCTKATCTTLRCPYNQVHMRELKPPFVCVLKNWTKEHKDCTYGKRKVRK